jgi:hypothetical protein
MKKVRIALSVLAVAIALSGTFANQFQSSDFVMAWEYVSTPEPACNEVTVDCVTVAQFPCTINSHPVGDSNTISNSVCGTQLRRATQ